MILFPPAKINLGLNVLRKRDDGFHNIETCMLAIPLTDVLEVLPADKFSFQQTGLTISGNEEQNLVVKAYRLMQKEFDVAPIYIHLLKNIPMGAGLGGGSADATYTILALNEIFDLQLSFDRMRELAGQLGSDCPFFVENAAQIAKGKGEILTSIDLNMKGYYLKVINPNIHIGTSEAYTNIDLHARAEPVREIIQEPIEEWKDDLQNCFESSAFAKNPVLQELKNGLYKEGAVYASMSGSGSTLYGIFRDKPLLTEGKFYERVLRLG